jgi:hypothetical protein
MLVNESAAIAVACIFAVLLVGALANFRITKFRVYLISGLSALLRLIAFSFNAAYFNDVSKGAPPNNNYFAIFFVLAGAGLTMAFAKHIIVLTCWFKNASEPSQPPFAKKLNLRIAVRWLLLPFITFGIILGACYATLVYGYPTSSHLETASKLRLGSSWAFFINGTLVMGIVSMAVYFSSTSPRRGGMEPHVQEDRLILLSFLCCLLLFFSVTISLVANYEPLKYARNPKFYYTLIVLPALIEQVIVTIPRLLARIALAARYDTFCKEIDDLKVEKKLGGVLNVFKTFRKTASLSVDITDNASSGSSVVLNENSNTFQEDAV